MKKKGKSIGLAVFSVLFLVLLDQWTKYLAVAKLAEGPFVIWDGVFELHYSINEGAAFGILQQKQALFVVLTMVVILCVCWFYLFRIPQSRRYRPLNILCVTLMAGAIGNLIDRVRQGYVVDFLYFKLINFPIFNVADCYVTFSAALLILLLLFYYKEDDLEGIL
ncbi:MAG: signal peptidase II [Lachnospiraceae bacterium]|nr:signal peptidase II [Lachnospiraceae bacterium]